MYPRQVAKMWSRTEMLENLGWQQDELKAATEDEEQERDHESEDDDKSSQVGRES